MIKLENTEVLGWEAAIRGMRNPMNSWEKSDSHGICPDEDTERWCGYPVIGPNDHKLMMNLAKAGSEESKFRRMIHVQTDITAPLYWISELDTYKVATVRNSCSFMHKGTAKPFEVNDFSIQNPEIYTVLSPIEKEEFFLKYPYETDEYRIYESHNGREYKVFKNGRIVALPFSITDTYGRTIGRYKEFPERELHPSLTSSGYFELNLGGRCGEKWLLHRLIATVWLPNPNMLETVNHIDGDKGNNSIENLEWCTLNENIQKGFNEGLYDKNKWHASYMKWKNGMRVPPEIIWRIKCDHKNGLKDKELSEKYNLPIRYINNVLFMPHCNKAEVFFEAYTWEKMIESLNILRDAYLETKNENYFQALRQLVPCGYNQRFTWDANYETLAAIYRQRKNHRLDEWHIFCDWIKTLPYSEIITLEETNEV